MSREDDPNSTPVNPERQGESWSLVSAAFGAVIGTVLAALLQPVLEHLPGRLFEDFLGRLLEDAISFGVPVLLAFAVARVRRLDHLLQRFLAPASLAVSLLLAASLWIRTGMPAGRWPLLALAFTAIESCLFLLFCGGAVGLGLFQIGGRQEEEYRRQREAEARQIADQAVAAGDPALAAGIFGANAGGEVSGALAAGCWKMILLLFHMSAIGCVSAMDAYFLFRLTLLWSIVAAVIIAAAATRVVTLSEEFGEQYSDSVPLDEKYHGILPR